jgi:uncharacterized cupin superfamily protein
MPTIIKPETHEFKLDPKSLKDFGLKTLSPRLGEMVKSKYLVFDIRELDPGMYSFPYHFHRNSEEMMMILSGSFTLRTPEGFSIINKGELVFFEMGESGAHQFYNHGQVPCIYLDIRTTTGLDITEYPDSGKINIFPTKEIFEKHSKVDYNKGEENVKEIWNNLRRR